MGMCSAPKKEKQIMNQTGCSSPSDASTNPTDTIPCINVVCHINKLD